MVKRTVSGLIFEGFELLDLFGPLELFGLLPDLFEVELVAEAPGRVASGMGPAAVADRLLRDIPQTDILLVPGGPGARVGRLPQSVIDWVAAVAPTTDLTLSVCTGSGVLAHAGLLDGKRATTNKAAFHKIAERSTKVLWQPKARWVEDGDIFTASGVSAGMDMALAVIERLHGRARAEEAAMWGEYTWHDDPDTDPFATIHGLT